MRLTPRLGRWSVALIAGLALLLAPDAPARAVKPVLPDNAVPGQYIVAFEDTVADVDAETRRQERAGGFRARFRYRSALEGFAARLSPAQVRRLEADPDVAHVTQDRRVEALGAVGLAAGEPTPPPGIRRMQAATATSTREASDTAVAVIDSGVDLGHPDLDVRAGTNCVTPGSAPADGNGHGTHVAGTVAARNDGAGVVGVAPGTRIYAVKVLDDAGAGTWSQVICGIDWVTANAATLGIGVSNMSLGGLGENDYSCGSTNGDPLHAAVCRSTAAGVLHVVAAGNDAWDIAGSPPDVPASYPEVLTVTAMGDTDGAGGATGPQACETSEADDRYASFSNYARQDREAAHMIAAPGVCIRSTWPGGGYATLSGTSMASPHVAGAAALCIGERGVAGPCAGMAPAEIIAHLRGEASTYTNATPSYGYSGDPLTPNKWGDYFGYLVRAPQDVTPPETTVSSGPSGPTNQSTASFEFSSDGGATFRCRLDAGAWAACTSPASYESLPDGAHSFEVKATDMAGNEDVTPASRSFTVDTVAPDTTISSGPSGTTTTTSAEFAFASGDATARFECRLDAGSWETCTSPKAYSSLAEGSHAFAVRALDDAGNVDAEPASRSFVVDTGPPETTIDTGPSGLTNQSSASFSFSSEAGATFECSLDGAAWSGCTSPAAYGTVTDGDHTFAVRATDAAGNLEADPARRSFTVDTVAPTTTLTSGPASTTKNTTPTFEFVSDDVAARFECRVDASAWAACSSPHRTAALADGSHTFSVRASDAAANVDTSPAAQTFTVDTTTTTDPSASDTTPSEPAPAPAPAPAAEQPAFSQEASSSAAGEPYPAKLQIRRATVRDGRLDVLAPITRRASGRVRVTFHAAGRRTRFSAPVDSERGYVRFRRRLPRAQARLGTGIVTLDYPGNARTRAQTVRLRAAANKARLTSGRPTISGGRLQAAGTVTGRARGVVRVQLSYVKGGEEQVFRARARIRDGRWRLTGGTLPAAARAGGHAYVLFTGYGPRRIRGEMRSLAVFGE